MYLEPLKFDKPNQAGFSMPVVIFIIVIMALLAAAIVQLSGQSNRAAMQEEISNRAFYSAESGASWAMTRIFDAAGANSQSMADGICNSGVNGQILSFNVAGLNGCNASLTCNVSSAGSASFYRVTSVGSCTFGSVQAARTVQVGARF